MPAVRAAALRARRDGRRHGRRRPLGAVARRASARCATTCSASMLVSGRGELMRFGGQRHQERRRLRRLAPPCRLARHPRRHRRGLAQGAAVRRPRRRCASSAIQGGAGPAPRLGRAATAARRQRVVGRQPDRAPARCAGGGGGSRARRSAASRSRPARRRRSGPACATTPTRSSPPRATRIEHQDAALWRLVAAADRAAARPRRRRADRMARRAALAGDGAAGRAGARGGGARSVAMRRRFAAPTIGRRLRAARAAARRHPRAAEALVRPERHLQSRPPLSRPLTTSRLFDMQTDIAPEFAGTAEGTEAEAILRKCVHCGFCTATCPTYQLLGDELDGPRGRIYLIKQVLEGARADAGDAAPPRPLPDLPQLRDHLPVGRAVRQPGRDRPPHRRRAGARPAGERALRWALKEGSDLAAVRAGDEARPGRARRAAGGAQGQGAAAAGADARSAGRRASTRARCCCCSAACSRR